MTGSRSRQSSHCRPGRRTRGTCQTSASVRRFHGTIWSGFPPCKRTRRRGTLPCLRVRVVQRCRQPTLPMHAPARLTTKWREGQAVQARERRSRRRGGVRAGVVCDSTTNRTRGARGQGVRPCLRACSCVGRVWSTLALRVSFRWRTVTLHLPCNAISFWKLERTASS